MDEPLKCINCDATFKSSTQLKRHTANAHCSRPFKCPHCPHRSKNKTNLERHVAFHTSNKDAFQCMHCGRKFAFRNSMKKHLVKGRCTVLKELEQSQRKCGKLGPGDDSFKNFLEATIMRHLQQTPESPSSMLPGGSAAGQPHALSQQQNIASSASQHKTLSSILSQQPQQIKHSSTLSNSNLSFVLSSNNGESHQLITSMDTNSPLALATLQHTNTATASSSSSTTTNLMSIASQPITSSYNSISNNYNSDNQSLQSGTSYHGK